EESAPRKGRYQSRCDEAGSPQGRKQRIDLCLRGRIADIRDRSAYVGGSSRAECGRVRQIAVVARRCDGRKIRLVLDVIPLNRSATALQSVKARVHVRDRTRESMS